MFELDESCDEYRVIKDKIRHVIYFGHSTDSTGEAESDYLVDFLNRLKGKKFVKTIREGYKNSEFDVKYVKGVSSLITHGLIDIENGIDASVVKTLLRVPESIELLTRYFNNNTIDHDLAKDIGRSLSEGLDRLST